jgi:integrase
MKPLSKTSISNYLRETRGFLRWLYRRKRIGFDHSVSLEGPRIRPSELVHPRRALADDELRRLLEAARGRPEHELRTVRNGARRGNLDARVTDAAVDAARVLGLERTTVYLLAAWSGLRRSELRDLTWEMLLSNPARLQLPGDITKNGDAATIFLHAEAEAALEMWRRVRGARLGPSAASLQNRIFRAIPSMRVLRKDLALAQIDYYREGVGFADFHSLRMTMNMRMQKAGLGTTTRQQLLRHSDPKLTDGVYLDPTKLSLASEIGRLPAIRADASPSA